MNKVLYVFLYFLCLGLVSCGNEDVKDGFELEGTIKGADKGFIILSDASNNTIDSVHFEKGRFLVKGHLDMPQRTIVYIADDSGDCMFFTGVFLANGKVTFEGDTAGFMTHRFIGSSLNDEYLEYGKYIASLDEMKRMNVVQEQKRKAFEAKEVALEKELSEERVKLGREVMKKIVEYKPDGRKSHVAAAKVAELAYSMGLEDQMYAVSLFDGDFTESYYINSLKNNIEREKKVAIGVKAPDFRLKDLSGKEYTLADFKGKYVYMDFSASWCGWCKKELPFIREAYGKLKNENIVFITINMDDKRELWEGDVKKENIEWLCLSDLNGMQSELARSYNISGIPAVFVLDPDGKIIARNVRQQGMVEYLTGLFGK